MGYLWNTSALSMIIVTLLLILDGTNGKEKISRRPYRERIMDRPDDVPVVKCGGEIKLTCVAEGNPLPEIEWRYYNHESNQDVREAMVKHAGRDGRIKIKTEELYVVRSTLIVKNADKTDQGTYQCRASNSNMRRNKGINIPQHWKIEEAPVSKVLCKDTVLTHTEVYPASRYNQSVFENAVKRVVTSASTTTSLPDLERKLNNGANNPVQPELSPITSTTTALPVKSKKSLKPKMSDDGDKEMKKSVINNSNKKLKKDAKKPRTVLPRESATDHVEIPNEEPQADDPNTTDRENSGTSNYGGLGMLIFFHAPLVILAVLTTST